MKRVLVLLVFVLAGLSAFAQADIPTVFESPFKPPSPVIVGQGGSFTANASGWDAFFTNPAGLAGKGSLTLVSVNPWLYSTGEMLDFVTKYAQGASAPPPAAGILARALPEGWDTITIDPGTVEAPAEYPGDFWGDMETLVNEFLAEADPTGESFQNVDTIHIPDTWADIDPATIAQNADYSQLSGYLQDFLDANPDIGDAIAEKLVEDVLPPGFPTAPKLRVGVAAGLGLIVRGFGLGFATILDVSVQGDTILSVGGDATLTAGFMAGYAHEFKLTSNIGLKVGGLLRPMFRVNAPVHVSALLKGLGPNGLDTAGLLDTLYATYGTGIGIDVGAILGVGPFSVGLAATDLFDTRLNYQQSSLLDIVNSIKDSQQLPSDGTPVEDAKHVIPMDVRLGGAFHPNLGALSFLIDPTVHFEVGNFLTVAREAKAAREAGLDRKISFGEIAAFGAEVRLLRFLKVRAGYYQGALSAGLGAKLLFLDANVAAYIAPKSGDFNKSSGIADVGDVGITAEFAVRF